MIDFFEYTHQLPSLELIYAMKKESLSLSILLLSLYILPICSFFHLSSLKLGTRSTSLVKMNEDSSTVATEEDWSQTFELIKENLFLPASSQSLDILSKQIEAANPNSREFQILKLSRQNILSKLLEKDRIQYLETVSQFGERIPRSELPNRQEVALSTSFGSTVSTSISTSSSSYITDDSSTIADCKLPNKTYTDSILDKLLLSYFRKCVQDEVKFQSPQRGIRGLLEEGRHYMVSPEGTPENQQRFVRKVLGRIFTPILPPFYRIFMSGIVPCKENNDPGWLVQLTDDIRSSLPESFQKEFTPGKQFGPWFYAPFLTSLITPVFLTFLVGPSAMNRRKDGQLGGMVVDKCKFLQESGCKGK